MSSFFPSNNHISVSSKSKAKYNVNNIWYCIYKENYARVIFSVNLSKNKLNKCYSIANIRIKAIIFIGVFGFNCLGTNSHMSSDTCGNSYYWSDMICLCWPIFHFNDFENLHKNWHLWDSIIINSSMCLFVGVDVIKQKYQCLYLVLMII